MGRELVLRVKKMMNDGQIICKDAEQAHEEQERLDNLLAQARAAIIRRRLSNMQQRNESDIQSQATSRVSSPFGLSVKSCSDNKINVQEAFLTGKVKPMTKPLVVTNEESSGDEDEDQKPAAVPRTIFTLPFLKHCSSFIKAFLTGKVKPMTKPLVVTNEESNGDEDEDQKPAAVPRSIFTLPFLKQCSVCYEENLKGYNLACGHLQCVECMRKLFRAALRDNTLLPLACCEVPIDMNIAIDLLDPDDAILFLKRVEEKEAKNKMYCPSCSSFINLDLIDSSQCSNLRCGCGRTVCTTCKTLCHPGYSCRQNQAIRSGSDELILELAREEGWKQCPMCSILIEFRSGCNHMTCTNCDHEFCYRCLGDWDSKGAECAARTCVLWDEDRLFEAGEARVQQEEAARGRRLAEPVRRERLEAAMEGLRANEVCVHNWTRSNGYKGDCPNCSFTMWSYGMRCRSDCGSTVCYTCAHHRIPNRGWR